jgi:digeranylgeranylglycerophospholipid reductase
MSTIKCDVLVVGAGPAGSSAARALAKKGLKTIIIEEDEEVGLPVQCAEGIGSYLFQYLPFEIPKNQLIWKIDGIYFWADGIAIKKDGEIWKGYSVNRSKWDKWLISLATKEGVEVFTKTKLVSFEFGEKNEVIEVTAIKDGKKITFTPKYVIGADGVDSTVINLLEVKKDVTVGHVKSYEINNLKLKYPRHDQIFFGEFAPRAYAYIFPLSKDTANFGIGTVYEDKNLDDLFSEFLNVPLIKKQVKNGNITIEKTGDAPVKNLTDKIVYGNVFLVGDAANQNIKPFIEGNIPGIICGNTLGELIFNVYKGKVSSQKYEKIINDKFNLIKESEKYVDIVYGETKIENRIYNLLMLGLMSESVSPDEKDIELYVSKGYDFLKNFILKNGGYVED